MAELKVTFRLATEYASVVGGAVEIPLMLVAKDGTRKPLETPVRIQPREFTLDAGDLVDLEARIERAIRMGS